jgi:hypothetical protein
VNSAAYWERRYRRGDSSGSGSYGRLARFKADFLNAFIAEHQIRSVIEFGSGDGAQLELASYPNYLGVDVSDTAVRDCRLKFAGKPSFRFCTLEEFDPASTAELTLSLDVIYHLVEDCVFEDHMRSLFDAATRFAIVYSSNADDSETADHVRHRHFTGWVEQQRRDFELIEVVANAFPFDAADPDNTSPSNFYVYRRVK